MTERKAETEGRPRWLVLTPFLRWAPELTERQWRVLGMLSVVGLFDQYDLSILSFALPEIQASLSIPEAQVGYLGSVIAMGAIPAVLAGLAADRLGRRRLLLITIVAYTVLTGATAFAPDARTYIALQFFARAFSTAELMLAVVVIAEEFGPTTRGWGVGALFAIRSCGVGLAAGAYPLAHALGLSWRSLYLAGLIPLVLVAYWRRTLPETERFTRRQDELAGSKNSEFALGPLLHLIRDYPGRFVSMSSVLGCLTVGGAAASFLAPKYLQEAHGWAPNQIMLLYVFGGAFGIIGATVAGSLSDRLGRKRMAIGLGLLVTCLAIAFYNISGWLLAPLWVAMIFCLIGHDTMQSTFGAEMFPTSHRSTAAGARQLVITLGASLGLALESVLYSVLHSHWKSVTLLLCLMFVAPVVVKLAYPETSGRDLDEIAPEREREPR
ncbi:MAG: MFS transporter [Deltaproteobacteria bacterium]|nr:MFS transporter [Deltaproteobacteria bacterium]MBW2390844.1 MFS transporter [Deltaproteobacteria bacterium]MBW2725125.1 MFS transporter [Deltaproteobacteria bacterium]